MLSAWSSELNGSGGRILSTNTATTNQPRRRTIRRNKRDEKEDDNVNESMTTIGTSSKQMDLLFAPPASNEERDSIIESLGENRGFMSTTGSLSGTNSLSVTPGTSIVGSSFRSAFPSSLDYVKNSGVSTSRDKTIGNISFGKDTSRRDETTFGKDTSRRNETTFGKDTSRRDETTLGKDTSRHFGESSGGNKNYELVMYIMMGIGMIKITEVILRR